MATAYPVAPRTDLWSGLFWIASGGLVCLASLRMDRMEQQGATLYSAPGLWPGIVGLILAGLGGLLVWRSATRARQQAWDAVAPDDKDLVPRSRFALAAAMFFIYALLLVGRGMPFWLGTMLFVTAFVYLFRRADRLSGTATGTVRSDALLAVVCGIATGVVVSLLFERLFYVRLP